MPTLTDTTCLILDVVVFFSFRDVEFFFFLQSQQTYVIQLH